MSEWISVKDRLSEDDKLVLIYCYNPYGENDFFIGKRSRIKLRDGTYSEYEWIAQYPQSSSGVVIDEKGNPHLTPRKVTHWMPLPEPLEGAQ